MYEIFLDIVELVESFGYLGIFIMTFIESTFIPIPAEITLIPAGYLVYQAKMSGIMVWTVSIVGTICGSLFNYMIALKVGRRLMIRYGKYMFLDEAKLQRMESFFKKHGAISMFTGRLLPGIKHFISFPAGLGKMDLRIFSFYTAAGAMLWCTILLSLGYAIGENELLIKKHLKSLNYILISAVSVIVTIYVIKIRNSRKNKAK